MKKTVFLLLMVLGCTMAKAQDWSFGGDSYETKRNNFGIELGVGGTGDVTVDLGVKWQTNLHENIAWDVITLKALADVENDLGESCTGQLMTGLRLLSPEFSGMTIYANARAGYAHNFDSSNGGFAFEAGVGVNVTRHIYLGYAYNQFKLDDVKVKYHAFRVGFLF